jgi:hypothetical protein
MFPSQYALLFGLTALDPLAGVIPCCGKAIRYDISRNPHGFHSSSACPDFRTANFTSSDFMEFGIFLGFAWFVDAINGIGNDLHRFALAAELVWQQGHPVNG